MTNTYRITRTLKNLKYPVSEVLSKFTGSEEDVIECCKIAESQIPDYIYSYEFMWSNPSE